MSLSPFFVQKLSAFLRDSAKEIRDARQEARRNYPELFTNMPQTNENEWERIAALFHATYERLAPSFGYKTREETAVAWEMVKENNRRLMTATVAEIMPAIVSEAERRGYERAMKEAREAVIPTVDTLTLYSRQGQEETIDVYYIPKSFFEK